MLALFVAIVAPESLFADWPNFRGPRHDGISDEKGIRVSWTEPIPLVWERKVGSAFSSFACVGDRVYTCGTVDKQQTLFCLNSDSGEPVWQFPFEKAYNDPQGGDGTRATPTVDEDRVYLLGGHGLLFCADAANGNVIWKKQFSNQPTWGYSGSVLIEGDLAIVSAGGTDGALVAFDKRTGDERWKCGDDAVGYATPYPFTFEGTRYVAGFMGKSLIIAELATGKLAYRGEWETDWEVNAAAPIYHDGHLWIGSGYHTGCVLYKLRKEGDHIEAEEVWKSKVLMNKFQSCILHEGHLYASDQKALVCVDFKTGEEKWRKGHIPNGTLVLADGHLLLLTEKGELQIAKVSPKEFEPITSAKVLSGRCWTVPVLHHGKLYARDLERLVCFKLAG